MNTKTKNALLARGIDSGTVDSLCSQGYSLSKLQSLQDFRELNLTREQIEKIQNGSRPPIPENTLKILLYKSASTCCMCRDKKSSIIVHHIEEWSKSRNHNEDNLIVLCLNCHAKAHSRSTISINFTADRLNYFKKEWLKEVKEKETNNLYIKSTYNMLDGFWDYFNHQRIIDLIQGIRIDLFDIEGYKNLLDAGVIDKSGGYIFPSSFSKNNLYLYDGTIPTFNRTLAQYYSNIVKHILYKIDWIHINDNFKKSTANLLKENTIIVVTGGHRFKRVSNVSSGLGQTIEGYKQGNGLKVVFSIDAWEATSSSSHGLHLSGYWICSSILLVRSIEVSAKLATVQCTCLAIGTGFTNYRTPVPPIAYREDVDSDEIWDEESEPI